MCQSSHNRTNPTHRFALIGNLLCIGKASGLRIITVVNDIHDAQSKGVFSPNKLTRCNYFLWIGFKRK